MPQTVRVIVKKPRGSGRRVGWNKHVTQIDTTKEGGFCFVGDFLDEREVDLEVGSVLVGRVPVGSAKSGFHWRVGIVTSAGVEWEDLTWSQQVFLTFRDHVQGLLRGDRIEIEALKEERARLLKLVHDLDERIMQSEQS